MAQQNKSFPSEIEIMINFYVCFEGGRNVLLLTVKEETCREQMLIKPITTLDNLINGDYESIIILAEYFTSARISPQSTCGKI